MANHDAHRARVEASGVGRRFVPACPRRTTAATREQKESGAALIRRPRISWQTSGQVAAGFAGLDFAVLDFAVLGLVALGLAFGAGFRAVAGLMLIGMPAGPAAAGSGSDRKNRRHSGESSDFLATMQAVTRSTSGISELQRRKASGWQACCSSSV